jgi:Fic family protein
MSESFYQRITPFPAEAADLETVAVDALARVWQDRLSEMRDSPALQRFNEQLYRRWAIETGILERLYTIDRGVTTVLVERGLDVALIEHGSTDRPPSEVIAMLRDHREAVDYVMEFVKGDQAFSLHFIRSLHEILTRNQHYVDGVDQFGDHVQLKLIRGDWKQQPNNPTRADGIVHQYCPPVLVQEEMENLVGMFRDAVQSGVPVTALSAWLHHRFTQIHPFQDGNGRVARALSAFVFVQKRLFPVVVERDDRGFYIECLEAADHGDLKPLITFWNRLQRRSIEAALSLSETVLGQQPVQPETLLRSRLLEAIGDQARKRRQAQQEQLEAVIATGRAVYRDLVQIAIEDLRADLEHVLTEIDSTYQCVSDHWSDGRGHWFRWQLVEVAKHHGYYADLEKYHQWSRLKLFRGDGSDDPTAEIVLSLHSLGRDFAGVLVLSGFIADRDQDDTGRSVTGPSRPLADRPLSFAYSEPEQNVRSRCQDWIEMALNVALEDFRKSL